MKKPLPEKFGLPADYDWNRRWKRIAAIDRTIERVSLLLGLICWCLFALLLVAFIDEAVFEVIGPLIAIPLWIAFLVISVYSALKFEDLLQALPGGKARAKERTFGSALRRWEDEQFETGQAYWQKKTRERFGEALKLFFVSRGCEIETIELSDERCLDLIVSTATASFYCRCDGRPISDVPVRTIREVADLAARRSLRPVLFLRSHWSQSPAYETTVELGVTCFSWWDLPELAAADCFQAPMPYRCKPGQLWPSRESPKFLAPWPAKA